MSKIYLPPPSQIRPIILLCQLCIIIFLSILGILENQSLLHAETFIYPSCILFIVLMFWYFWSWTVLTKSLFSPYILFISSAAIFNGGHIFLEVLKINPSGILSNRFSADTTLQTIYLVTLSIAAIHLGALFSTATVRPIQVVTPVNNSPINNSPINNSLVELAPAELPNQLFYQSFESQDIRKVGWILLTFSLPPTLLLLKNAVETVSVSGYTGLYESGAAEGSVVKVLTGFLIPSALFLLAGSKQKLSSRRLAIGLVFMYSGIYNFLGQRTNGILPLIGLAWLWHHVISPLPKKIFLPITFFTAFVISPLIAEVRSSTGLERFSFGSIIEKFTSLENPIAQSLFEFGGTMQTIAYTIELVPAVKDFSMGVDYLYALLTLVPNIGLGEQHPTYARGVPSAWLSAEVTPRAVIQGIYLGYSFIAEAFLNFGWIGAPIIMAIFGFYLGKLILWATRLAEPAKMAVIASFLPSLLFFCRQESTQIIRPFFLYCLFPYLGISLFRRSRLKKSNQMSLRNKSEN